MLDKHIFLEKQTGLALVEILFSFLIISLLISYGALKWFSHERVPKAKVAIEQMQLIAEALDRFHQDNQRYPTTEEGLHILTEKLATHDPREQNPYLDKSIPNDPWGNPYLYQAPGKEKGYDLISLGADGKVEGTGEDADITY